MKNFVRGAFVRDPNLFLAVAVVACVIDIMRVMPLMLADAYLAEGSPGTHLYLGVADGMMLLFLFAATPRIAVLMAMVGGSVLGIVIQVAGLPALSGWISISIPWILANRRAFDLSARERLHLMIAILFVLGWGALIWTGHVIDPGMQGENSIGWLYGVKPVDELHPGLLVQFHKGNFLFVRRIQEISDDEVVLAADNPDFGEDYKQLRVPESDVTGQVSWLFYPTRIINRRPEWQRKAITIGQQTDRTPAPCSAGLYHNTRLETWVVVGPEWNVIQSGTGSPHVVGNFLVSVGNGRIVVYDSSRKYDVIGRYSYTEVGIATTVAIIYSSDGEVKIIDREGGRLVGNIEVGESLGEAARRIGLPQPEPE